MTGYLLDTNICAYIINRRPLRVREKLMQFRSGQIMISSITVAELAYGAEKSHRTEQNYEALTDFLLPLTIAEFDYKAAIRLGRVRLALEQRGTPIGPLDTLIAAHALSLDATLVTNNTREFARVPELKLENWAEV